MRSSPRTVAALQKTGLLVGLIGLTAGIEAAQPAFLHLANIQAVLLRVAVMGIVAVPGAMLLMAGYVDLSVGSAATLATIVFGQAFNATHSVAAAVTAALFSGVAVGALNGELIARRGLSPVIVTLGGLAGYNGIAELLSQGQTIFGFGHAFDTLGTGHLAWIPIPALIFLVLFALAALFWYATPLGSRIIAIGTNRAAARAVGISTKTLPFFLYIGSGLTAAIGGVVMTAQLDSASLSIGTGLELQVLTAVLLGGVSFEGGRGSFGGVLTGLFFLGVLYDGLVLLNVSPFWSDFFVGVALAVAAGLDAMPLSLG